MEPKSTFRVPLSELDAVHVPAEERVEGQQPTPPAQPLSSEDERERANLRSAGGPV